MESSGGNLMCLPSHGFMQPVQYKYQQLGLWAGAGALVLTIKASYCTKSTGGHKEWNPQSDGGEG